MAKLKVLSISIYGIVTEWRRLHVHTIGERLGSHVTYLSHHFLVVALPLMFILETMAAHRANSLLAILPLALQTGYSEIVPELEPLKVQCA
jgi:hypothetical protein